MTRRARLLAILFAAVATAASTTAQTEIGAAKVTPNLVSNIERPLRYRPDHGDFVIENGGEFFNRPLYGGNTAFRVDGGDKPELVLYLPGRGGNLRFGMRTPAGAKWLHDAARIETRYRPGELRYEIADPLFGQGTVSMAAIAYAETEGLIVRLSARGVPAGSELIWVYGGVNGQRGKRDGDIGTESVPISEWFQLRPAFCRDNAIEIGSSGFTLRAKPATIFGVLSVPADMTIADANDWNDLPRLLDSAKATPSLPVVVGRVRLTADTPVYLSLQRVTSGGERSEDLAAYREVSSPRSGNADPTAPDSSKAERHNASAPFSAGELATKLAAAEQHFAELRQRVSIETPDPFLDAAVGALNVAADAVWDEPQHAIMHGAIAWRVRLLGWRGPYMLDALGRHDRARANFTSWLRQQNTTPIPARVPPPDEKANLARNEAGLHTNGDISNSHYDMNLVFMDALFRHLQWTGDLAFAKQAWLAIERHLAWERRLFRREFGPAKLPLYEAYAAIWASDDLQYSGGGAAHASAYNYYENRQAARLARLIGADPAPYDREADLIARGMRELLWVTREGDGTPRPFGWFAECKDWLGEQRVHPSAALWTFYHTIDSQVPTPQEAWQMAEQVAADIPHLPVRGGGVPEGLQTLATSRWLPYDWSINNVVMGEAVHGALALWEAGRPEEAFSILKGSVLAAMNMGISPGNVGSMSYLDVYRRESQRDFADGGGVLSRALVEGLFGVRPDALAGELAIAPGWPAEWDRAAIRHPDFALEFKRTGDGDTYVVQQRWGATVRLTLAARRDRVASVTIDGQPATWKSIPDSVGVPRIEIVTPGNPAARAMPPARATRQTITIRWAGDPIRGRSAAARFAPVEQGEMRWLAAPRAGSDAPSDGLTKAQLGLVPIDIGGARFETVDLGAAFNDRVTQIFQNEYRAPRSPFVSLALPKQGIGGWAGGVARTAVIDDAGLRAVSAEHGGRITLPNDVPFATPSEPLARNVVFTSQWDNYPRAAAVPLAGRARAIYVLVAGSTNPMQSQFENGEVAVTYADGSTTCLPLINPTNWWPLEQDYLLDDYQFRRDDPLPMRIDLKTGRVRVLAMPSFKGRGTTVAGGAATVLALPLESAKELKQLTVRATANDVVIGLMAATLVR